MSRGDQHQRVRTVMHNLPAAETPVQLTAPPPSDTFAGRSAELDELTRILLRDGSAAIFSAATTGMGGIGKTTVAQKLGIDLRGNSRGGVLWLDVGFGAMGRPRRPPGLKVAVDLADELLRPAASPSFRPTWPGAVACWSSSMTSGFRRLGPLGRHEPAPS